MVRKCCATLGYKKREPELICRFARSSAIGENSDLQSVGFRGQATRFSPIRAGTEPSSYLNRLTKCSEDTSADSKRARATIPMPKGDSKWKLWPERYYEKTKTLGFQNDPSLELVHRLHERNFRQNQQAILKHCRQSKLGCPLNFHITCNTLHE